MHVNNLKQIYSVLYTRTYENERCTIFGRNNVCFLFCFAIRWVLLYVFTFYLFAYELCEFLFSVQKLGAFSLC